MDRDGIEESRSPDAAGAGRASCRSGGSSWAPTTPAARRARRSARSSPTRSGEPRAAGAGAGENGKPRLAVDPGRLSFNLSHSGGLALVALAPGGVDVGVDVERIKQRRDLARLAARWLPEADARAVAAVPRRRAGERVFYAAWTRHEARVKCTGVGLAGDAARARGGRLRRWQIDAGYAAAVAIDGVPRRVRDLLGMRLPPVIWTNARQAGFGMKRVDCP